MVLIEKETGNKQILSIFGSGASQRSPINRKTEMGSSMTHEC